MDLHMFGNETDRVIAHNLEDAIEEWEQTTGESWSEYADEDEWEQVPDNEKVALILVDEKEVLPEYCPVGAVVEWANHWPKITATARAWCDHIGRREFFSSTEW